MRRTAAAARTRIRRTVSRRNRNAILNARAIAANPAAAPAAGYGEVQRRRVDMRTTATACIHLLSTGNVILDAIATIARQIIAPLQN